MVDKKSPRAIFDDKSHENASLYLTGLIFLLMYCHFCDSLLFHLLVCLFFKARATHRTTCTVLGYSSSFLFVLGAEIQPSSGLFTPLFELALLH